MMRKILFTIVLVIVLLGLCGLVYNLPPIHERLAWRIENWSAQIKYALNPPEAAVFVPKSTPVLVPATAVPSATPTPTLTPSPTQPGPTSTPLPTNTPSATPTPIPPKTSLTGVVHEYQQWNNCGPANLAMLLSYWGWKGDQRDTAAYLKPNQRDKNVMPYEMVSFVQDKTDLRVVVRMGGDLDLLKKFIAAGFPVIVEKGFEGPGFDGWMGHYEVLTGYDDARQKFTAQDSYIQPNLPVTYQDMLTNWRAFNYLYIVVYPADREAELMAILGPQADVNANYQYAAQKASDDIAALSGRDKYFAWYNRGTNLMYLKDFGGAATAYDAAFAQYPSIPEKQRPWRMLWYQTGPFFAYYYTQRYYDVINLATVTLDNMSEPILEESYFWRGRAKAALGDTAGAITDFRAALQYHPDFAPALEQLGALGATP